MAIENIVISAFITIFSLGLFVIALSSYQKYKNTKLLFVTLVFLVFFVKGILLSLSFFYNEPAIITGILQSGLFDLLILLLLFVATLKR